MESGSRPNAQNILPEWAVVEIALFLPVCEAQLGMARVCRDWRRIFSHDDWSSYRRVCFREFGCDPVLPPGLVWEEWIEQLRELVRMGIEERHHHQVRWWSAGALHSGSVVLPQDFHYRFTLEYASSRAKLEQQIVTRRKELSWKLQSLYCSAAADNEEARDSRRLGMIDCVMSLRALASEQRDLEVTFWRHEQRQKRERQQAEENNYRKTGTSQARRILTRILGELTQAAKDPDYSDASRLSETADGLMLGLLPDKDLLGSDKARCLELRLQCKILMNQLRQRANMDTYAVV